MVKFDKVNKMFTWNEEDKLKGFDMNYELKMILEKIKEKFFCVYEGERRMFLSKEEFEQSNMEKSSTVSGISSQGGVIVLELEKWESPMPDMNEEWVRKHEEKFGEKLSFF